MVKKIRREEWLSALDKILTSQSEEDLMLHPSRKQIRYLLTYLTGLDKNIKDIELLSALAHDGYLLMNEAQRMLDFRVAQIRRDLRCIEELLEPIKQDDI